MVKARAGDGLVDILVRGLYCLCIVVLCLRLTPLYLGITIGAALLQIAAIKLAKWEVGLFRGGISPALVLGFGVVTLPLMGSAPLLINWFLFLLLTKPKDSESLPLSTHSFVLVCAAWCLAEIFLAIDVRFLVEVVKGAYSPHDRGWWALSEWMRSSNPAWYQSFEYFSRFFLISQSFVVLSTNELLKRDLLRGLVVALTVAIPVAGFQIWTIMSGDRVSAYFPNANSYWDSLGRIPATFTDPNAFGTALVLALPLVFHGLRGDRPFFRSLSTSVCAFWVVLGFYSGSRTFVAGIALITFLFLLQKNRRLVAWALMCALLVVILLTYSPELQGAMSSRYVPEALRRVSQSLVLDNLRQSTFSRFYFWNIAATIFISNPWIGIGLSKFRELVVPLGSDVAGVPELWTDNANSFYLQVGTELGVLGLGCLLLVASSARFKRGLSPLMLSTLVSFLLLLSFGPHLEFAEVALMFSLLLSLTVSWRSGVRDVFTFAAALLLVPVIFIKAQYGQFGFFDWERDGARYFRWTEKRAQGWVQCLPGAENSEVFLRASRPPGRIEPALVAISTIAQESESILLRGDDMQAVPIRCPRQDAIGAYQVPYWLSVSNPWSPRIANIGGDPRVFGIQVVTRAPQSTLPF